eukprot:CAMPEP_0113944718 /NCGR_PEP_ID=MMETSP1339-20121228/36057_1 /TAXON_ID=94617 /ORGANISM="Fibrocapsa japonica" /LENGTH=186 /DNA_ID=CAMNT_0000950011 /DNA_START=85 /DNA_END=645 /DNA_ORIENTATION=+ /assembly_acc=CAM_ASM_000762
MLILNSLILQCRSFHVHLGSNIGASTRLFTKSSQLRMGIFEDVSTGIKDAMKAGEKEKLSAFRNIRAALLTETKQAGAGDTLPDAQCLPILRKLAKQRVESIEAFEQAGRTELADAERAELVYLEEYLPKLADEATTRQWVQEAIESTGASGPSEMGKVMGALMKAHKAELDGKLTQKIVTEELKK